MSGAQAPAAHADPVEGLEEELASDDADLCVTHANTCAALEEFGDAQRLCAARPAPPAHSGGAIPPAQRNAAALRRTPL